MDGLSDDADPPTLIRLGPTGLGTAGARIPARVREAEPPSPSPPHKPFAGRLAAHLSEAMVETAAWVDIEADRAREGSRPEPLRLQRLSYPFPSRISPHAEAADVHSMDWLAAHGLVSDQAGLDRFTGSHFGILAGRTYPEATAAGLNWVADWCVWLFAFDDRFCDESALGLHPGKLARQVVPIVRVLDYPTAPVPERDRFVVALADLRDRFAAFGSPQQWARFASATRAYLLGIIWEAAHREAGESPSVADYSPMRVHAGATWTTLGVLDAVCGHEVPDTQYFDPVVARVGTMAVNLIGWCNDLYSYGRESTSQESMVVHNLVAVIASERRCSLQNALDRARRMHEEELAGFVGLLPLAYQRGGARLRRYLDGLGMWLAGNEAWSLQTSRYEAGEHVTIYEGDNNLLGSGDEGRG